MKKVLIGFAYLSSTVIFIAIANALSYSQAHAQNVTFTDVTNSSGVVYARTPSIRNATAINFRLGSQAIPVTPLDIPAGSPMRNRGIPGVALFDYDNDGDLDMYLTNGPGTSNSLYSNQMQETGSLSFIDVTASAWVESTTQDNNGACFADIDNDGDEDLFVVAHEGPNHLYENQGDGTFLDITGNSPFVTNGKGGNSCAFGDINNDGLVDLYIARGYDLNNLQACFLQSFGNQFQHNELYINNGNNLFSNVSDTSGIKDMYNYPPGNAGFTWSAALVDYDLDGDLDLFNTDDHCATPVGKYGGIDRGYMQIWDNDGSGNFTNVTGLGETGTEDFSAGSWMGISFADYNHDGRMDFHATNFGDWARPFVGAPYEVGDESSVWFYQNAGGSFDREFAGLISTPFGWGTISEDIDNDGDTDVVFHGGLDLALSGEASNAGSTLINDGTGIFTYDANATSVVHNRREIAGVAAGDLNGDGYVDIVSMSGEDYAEFVPLVPYAAAGIIRNSDFDATASFIPTFAETSQGSGLFSWTGIDGSNGSASVEINNAESGNGRVAVRTMGTVGLTSYGSVNRDGIGAVTFFTPKKGKTAMKPVAAGSSHVSSDSLEQNFGLGNKNKGTLEVLWPGGVRNKLYKVRDGEKIVFPEIPCSYDQHWYGYYQYKHCVNNALNELKAAGIITKKQKRRFRKSAVRAFYDHHYN